MVPERIIPEATIQTGIDRLIDKGHITINPQLRRPEVLVEQSLATMMSGDQSPRVAGVLVSAAQELRETAKDKTPIWGDVGQKTLEVSGRGIVRDVARGSISRIERGHDALVEAFTTGNTSLAEVAFASLTGERRLQRPLRDLLKS
ncbi:MAG TPA: hypothetical protein VLF93_00430 [Candidatus Saccharimonadales bacterium]|nr:hypothetical protein [Candidatus Saccharimonadales bacterium]